MTVVSRLALVLLLAGCAQSSSPTTTSMRGWETGDYRETMGGPVQGPITRESLPLKLDQIEVIRPTLAPGDRARLVARYTVSLPTPVDVRETRVIRYGDRVVHTRETVVKRSRGQWESEYTLPIPPNAVEGYYTLTTQIDSAATTRGGPETQVKTYPFQVVRGKPAPAAAASSGSPNVRIRLWTDKKRYKIGEKVTFNFETSVDGYVTLVDAGTSGACTVLFPNRYSGGDAVKAKTQYSVPRQQDAYSLLVSGPAGTETVYAVLTVEPMKVVEGEASRACDFLVLTRNINVVVNRTAPDKQDRATLEIEVVP